MNKITSLVAMDVEIKQCMNYPPLAFALGFALFLALLFAIISIYWRYKYNMLKNKNKPVVAIKTPTSLQHEVISG